MWVFLNSHQASSDANLDGFSVRDPCVLVARKIEICFCHSLIPDDFRSMQDVCSAGLAYVQSTFLFDKLCIFLFKQTR